VEVLSPPEGAVVLVRRRRKRKRAALQVILHGFRKFCTDRSGSRSCMESQAGSGESGGVPAAGNDGVISGGGRGEGLRSAGGGQVVGIASREENVDDFKTDDAEKEQEETGEEGDEEEEEGKEETVVEEEEAVLEAVTAGEILCVMYKVCLHE